MNNPSPFIPQGSFVEQKNKGRARVKIAVFFVLAVHGVGLLALLLQGCHRDDKEAKDSATNAVDNGTGFAPTNPGIDTNIAAATQTPSAEIINTSNVAVAAPTEYVIAKGDTFSTLASKFRVSVRALENANPGVDARRLQIGQKIKIPPPTPPSATSLSTPGGPASVSLNGEQMYTVVSGDTLTTIAQKTGTTVRDLRSYNNLSTDRITVGQK